MFSIIVKAAQKTTPNRVVFLCPFTNKITMLTLCMNASQILASRNNKRIIEGKYIQQVLQEEANNIEAAQNEVYNNFKADGFSNIKDKRRFSVAGATLIQRHDIRQRFIDMKRLKGKNRKPVPVHNKIIWGHFNNIIFKLAYGFTQDVKTSIAKNYQIEL